MYFCFVFLLGIQDLDDFINEAEHGVVLFSLGSVVSEKSLGADKLNGIFEAFAKLEQRVIMKFDAESYETQPSNVKIVKWFPQRDLLGMKTHDTYTRNSEHRALRFTTDKTIIFYPNS